MISYADAFSADIFHTVQSGFRCRIWRRVSQTYPDGISGFLLFVTDDRGEVLRISDLFAEFHTERDCPLRVREDRPPGTAVSDQSEQQPTLTLGSRDADGRDELGFDADGYDREGYDADGRDRDGYDRDGYDANDEDRDGRPRPGSVTAADLDLNEEWSAFPRRGWGRQDEFRAHLRELVSDPDEIDELAFCGNCQEPAWDEDLTSAADGSMQICSSCWDDWYTCSSCEERYPSDEIYEVLSGSDVCERCRDRYYSYCEDCDGYYHDEDYGYHEHGSGDGCCDSPQLEFAIRNDGCDPLRNDVRVTITLPAGHISSEGITVITRYLRAAGHFDLSYDLGELGDAWQTRQGNYTRRLSRLAYQKYQAKLSQDTLSQVGVIARNHSNQIDVAIEITRDLNMSASDFYHDDSCWWGSYSESRCALKTNGGFGLRSFSSWGSVSGRAWVMPLRLDERGRLVPTFETMTPDAFVVFNGYGDLAGYAPARIIAHMAGWTYRKIGFACEPMYVNAGGYLIAPEHIAEQYTDGALHLSVDQHSRLYQNEKETLHV